jgi:hypothetical protein
LEELAHQLNQPVEAVVAALDEQGFDGVSPSVEIVEIAKTNAVAPSTVYQAMTKRAEREGFAPGGAGLGRMTLGELCSSERLGLKAVMEALSERGVKAEETSPVRELAAALNVRPGQLASMIRASIDGAVAQPGSFSCASSVERTTRAK